MRINVALVKPAFLFAIVLTGMLFILNFKRKIVVPDLLTNVTDFVGEAQNGYLVPNIVHMLHFGSPDLTFFEVVSLKAAKLHQKPEKIYVHCECQKLEGKYWDMVKDIPELELRFKKQPTHVFGQKLDSVFHASDVARLEIMMQYGGIYIDTDTYIVSSLDEFRQHEFAIGWPHKEYLGTQTLVAHKNARFLKLWHDSYKYYDPDSWYFNAGILPTVHILQRMPSLVHRVPRDFGVDYNLKEMMYERDTEEWKTYKTIHYLIRHQPKHLPVIEFDEENIKTYRKTFGSMARLVLYGNTDVIS